MIPLRSTSKTLGCLEVSQNRGMFRERRRYYRRRVPLGQKFGGAESMRPSTVFGREISSFNLVKYPVGQNSLNRGQRCCLFRS